MRRALLVVGLFSLACVGGKQGEEDGPPSLTADEQLQLDIEHYEQVEANLRANRSLFANDGPTELVAVGSNLFWLNYHQQWDPTLYVVEPGQEPRALRVLSYDDLNYRVSDELVVTAVPDFNTVDYQVMSLDGTDLGTTSFDAPGGGRRWWAFAADGEDVYVVDEDADELLRFAPGGQPEVVTTFTDLGVSLGLFMDFDVEDGELIFVESGRIWTADLDAGTATWLENETEATAVDTNDTHIVYKSAEGLQIVDRATLTTVALADAVSGYQLNGSFTNAHQPTGGTFSVVGDKLVYLASDGVFGYDLVTGAVEPLLLDPRYDGTLRVEYINPTATEDGLLYVKGLESESGSVGADGPIYVVDPDFLD